MIYAIGDIHGQVTMLGAMLKQLREQPLREEDTVVFLGDYIDRGENTRATIEMLLEFRQEHANTIFLRGNHEQLMLDARREGAPQAAQRAGYLMFGEMTLTWLQNGGTDALDSYGINDYSDWFENIPEEHWEFVENTRIEYVVSGYHFVHAGLVPPGVRWHMAGTGLEPRLWIRDEFLKSTADFEGRIVVFGHTPQMSGRPLIQPTKLGIDTGAVFGGPLTAAIIDISLPPTAQSVRFLNIWREEAMQDAIE